MQKVEIFRYYQFGYNYYILLHASDTCSNQEMQEKLEAYFDFVSDLNLRVTESGIDLKGLYGDYGKLMNLTGDEKTKDKKVSNELYAAIHDKLLKIDSILDAELNIKVGYTLDEKRYSNEILTEEIYKLFGKDVFNRLPSIAQYDFKECGLCLAFDRYTAAAFHALRGTEDVLKFYYSQLIHIVPNPEDTWWTFTDAIENAVKSEKLKPPPPEQLMTNLNILRKHYRNRTQHPDLMFSLDDVQDIISICTKTINDIINDLLKRGLLAK